MFLTPELFRGDNWFFTSGPDVSLRGEARLRELELRPGLEARLLAEVGAGPGNSELVEQDENEELLCFLSTVGEIIINRRSLHNNAKLLASGVFNHNFWRKDQFTKYI